MWNKAVCVHIPLGEAEGITLNTNLKKQNNLFCDTALHLTSDVSQHEGSLRTPPLYSDRDTQGLTSHVILVRFPVATSSQVHEFRAAQLHQQGRCCPASSHLSPPQRPVSLTVLQSGVEPFFPGRMKSEICLCPRLAILYC